MPFLYFLRFAYRICKGFFHVTRGREYLQASRRCLGSLKAWRPSHSVTFKLFTKMPSTLNMTCTMGRPKYAIYLTWSFRVKSGALSPTLTAALIVSREVRVPHVIFDEAACLKGVGRCKREFNDIPCCILGIRSMLRSSLLSVITRKKLRLQPWPRASELWGNPQQSSLTHSL